LVVDGKDQVVGDRAREDPGGRESVHLVDGLSQASSASGLERRHQERRIGLVRRQVSRAEDPGDGTFWVADENVLQGVGDDIQRIAGDIQRSGVDLAADLKMGPGKGFLQRRQIKGVHDLDRGQGFLPGSIGWIERRPLIVTQHDEHEPRLQKVAVSSVEIGRPVRCVAPRKIRLRELD
jgi:hypothetical protein